MPEEEQKQIKENKQKLTSSTASESWVKDQISIAKKELKDDADKTIREQVQTDKASLITVFGIFASVISFLTIEFQFLKTVCSFEKILGFTLILFSLLFGFNVALDYLVKSRLDKETPKPNTHFLFLVILLFLIGVFLSFNGNEEICKNNEIYYKYAEQYNERIRNIENNINLIKKQETFINQ